MIRAITRIVALAVIIILGLAGWHTLHRGEPVQLARDGLTIQDPEAPLRTAERQLNAVVAERHGARTDHTRCYYTTQDRLLSGQVNVGDTVACGPVLFVDGDPATPYLNYGLQVDLAAHPSPGHTVLSVAAQPDETTSPANADGTIKASERELIRPDGSRPPAGADGLSPPAPPPAVGDVLTKTSVVGNTLRLASSQAVVIGHTTGVRLREFGFVDRYGRGDAARSAEKGRKLLAFQTESAPGESGAAAPVLSVRIDGVERGPLISTSEFVVVAVPLNPQSVDLILTDSGVKQSISLLTGQVGTNSPELSTRANRVATMSMKKEITVRVSGPAGTGITSGHITFTKVWLSYFGADGTHASSPDRAFLHVMATVRLDGDTHDFGIEPGLLSVSVDGSTPVRTRNAAGDTGEIDDVSEVPADVVSGAISYSGSAAADKGTLSVVTPVTVPFTIPMA